MSVRITSLYLVLLQFYNGLREALLFTMLAVNCLLETSLDVCNAEVRGVNI